MQGRTVLEGSEQLERELAQEPVFKPAAGALLLHAALFGGVLSYGLINGLMHHNVWGSNGGGAIQVSLVSGVLPLPSDQPPNENVLATDKPSPAPAAPEPKAKQAVDEKAIAISGKKASKPEPKTAPRTPAKQQTPTPQYRAQYGEQAGSSMPHALTQGVSIGQTTISEGDFGSRFGWYVEGINRKMAQNWYKGEVDPRTPKGTRVYLTFSIARAGTPGEVKVDRSSGVPTLDRSCQRAAQRVDTFGALPQAYNLSTLRVSYYCEY